jgi:hypothetical protein
MPERARTRLIWRQVRLVGWAVHVARERQFCAPGLSALPMLTARSQPHSAGCTRCERDVPAGTCRRRHVARPWPGAAPPTASRQWGRRTSPPRWPTTAACSGMGRVKVPRPKISSIRGARTASRSIPLEASSLGGSTEQAGGRSAPGEVGDLRLDSFRVTPCSRKTAPAGSRPGRAGSECSPAIGWHRFSELARGYW